MIEPRARRLAAGCIVLLSLVAAGCVDTTSAPSSITVDPKAAIGLAGELTARNPDFSDYNGCLAVQLTEKLSPQGLEAIIAGGPLAAKLAPGDVRPTDAAVDACMSSADMARVVLVQARERRRLTVTDAEIACGAPRTTDDPKYRTASATLQSARGDADATADALLVHVAGCMSALSVEATMFGILARSSSVVMAGCVYGQEKSGFSDGGKLLVAALQGSSQYTDELKRATALCRASGVK